MGFDKMIKLIRSGRVEGLGKLSLSKPNLDAARTQVLECRACVLGKQARTSFDHRGLTPGLAPVEVLHMDSYVVKCEGRDGTPQVQYGVLVTDTFSRESWHACAPTKDAVAEEVIKLVQQIQREHSAKVKFIATDGGTEFLNHTLKGWLGKEGIKLRVSPPHTQQLDGVSERNIRTFKDNARTLVHHAHAPQWMWRMATTHAVWVWNRTQVGGPTGVTPYEQVSGRVPSLKEKYVGVWGCDCWVHQRKELRKGAMAAKSEPGIYLGHTEEHGCASVLLLSTGKKVNSRDVKFRNTKFVHMRALCTGPEAVAAVLDGTSGDTEDSLEDLDDSSDKLPAQGGRVQPSAALADSSDEAQQDDECEVERILQRRVIKATGAVQFRVRWTGFGAADDTWEPEENVGDCIALDEFLDAQKHNTRGRRSPRLDSGTSFEAAAAEETESSDDPTDSGGGMRVEMAMCALRQLQTDDERPADTEVVRQAIAKGISALEDSTPKNYRGAMASKDAALWKAARQKEMNSCIKQGVWEEVLRSSLPKGTKVLPCKDVYKIKLDELGKIKEHKARYTPMGNFQRKDIDYKETFAKTGMYKTERVALSFAAGLDNELVQFDVPTAFLHAPVDEVVYMSMPQGFGKDHLVCRLLKSLYGLKQSPRNWDKLIHGFITNDMGWKATASDPCLYYKRSKTGKLMLIYRFVDDMQGQHHATDAAEFAESAAMLRERFNITQQDTATWMLGMRITRDRKARTIKLDQELYVSKALERFGLSECKSVSTPELPGADNDLSAEKDAATDRQRYMEIVGTLMYAGISTRPDISHAVHSLASKMQDPRVRNMEAAERVLRYLAGTKDIGLTFGAKIENSGGDSRGWKTPIKVDVCCYADADWANDKGDRKSISGWVAKINGDVISWSSKKQRVVALSTCEAELYAEAAAIQEVLWIRGLLAELGMHTSLGSQVYGDNQSTIAVSKNGVKRERTKHVDVKYQFITETVESGKVQLVWVRSSEQQADIFTKALAAPVFLGLRKNLMTR